MAVVGCDLLWYGYSRQFSVGNFGSAFELAHRTLASRYPMAANLDSYALPPAVQRVVRSLQIYGWIGFWAQIVLSVVALLVLVFSNLIVKAETTPVSQATNNPGSGAGLALALLGNLLLLGGAYWAFRYTRLSRQLKSAEPTSRPTPGDVMQAIKFGLYINLAGMFITLLGGEALIGSLFAKALSQPQSGAAFYERISQAIQPLDVLIVQANTNIILAHFIGLVVSLWLLRSMSRQ